MSISLNSKNNFEQNLVFTLCINTGNDLLFWYPMATFQNFVHFFSRFRKKLLLNSKNYLKSTIFDQFLNHSDVA